MTNGIQLIEKLKRDRILTKEEFISLLQQRDPKTTEFLFAAAREIRHGQFGHKIYIRGLIEISNYCKNNCYYCGIRGANHHVERYRLTPEEILSCCRKGYRLGFRTFVLQGGEDGYYTDGLLADLLKQIKKEFPDCAITLSLGERSRESYQRLYEAGGDRYLLRHETANEDHYRKLHPPQLSLDHRKECLRTLKEIGYQTGTGFMVGSPGQTLEYLAEDLLFIRELQPQMVGIGPFVPHHDTPFGGEEGGTVELTLFLLGILRIMLPNALLPATTALGTIDPMGREKGILAGANVVMPNLSPIDVRKKYELYDNKLCTGDETAEALADLKQRMEAIGYEVTVDRGDYKEEC